MVKIFYIIFLGFIAVSIHWYFRIFISYRWLKNSRKMFAEYSHHWQRDIYVLIPVLDETRRIKKTVEYFTETFRHIKNLHIILISTEKEFELFDKKTRSLLDELKGINQIQLIHNFINLKCGIEVINTDNSLTEARDRAEIAIRERKDTIEVVKEIIRDNGRVNSYHYPRRDGNMASQLNYAISLIIKNNKCDDALFCIYNADSMPHPKTLDWVLYMSGNQSARVFQQYGNYLKNIQNFTGVISGNILKAAALWQTRWSIGFEIYYALKQLRFKNYKQSLNYPLNYCIGHGLFFTKDIYENLGGFNEGTHNEDAIFGLELSYLGELIMPIPYFDESDVPDSVKSLYKQKANWFFGPLQAFDYYKEIVDKLTIKEWRKRIRLFILSSKLFFHAVCWISGPTFMAVSFIIALYQNSPYLWAAFITESILFLSVPSVISWFISGEKSNKSGGLILSSFLGAIPCYLLHGLSAYKTLFNILTSKMFNKKIVKEKTAMS